MKANSQISASATQKPTSMVLTTNIASSTDGGDNDNDGKHSHLKSHHFRPTLPTAMFQHLSEFLEFSKYIYTY